MQTLTIPTPCASAVEAARKTAALTTIAASLDVDSLAILATVATKKGANDKLKKNKTALLAFASL